MFFTGLRRIHAQVVSGNRQIAAFADDYLALRKRLTASEATVSELATKIATLESQLHKLRGQVHGPRAQLRAVGSVESIPLGDKDALRAHVGLAAGKKFTHPEE